MLYIWLFNMSSRLHCQLSDALSNVYISVIFFYLKIDVIFQHSEEHKSIRERKVISNLNIYVQFSHSVVSDSLWPHKLQHTRPRLPGASKGDPTHGKGHKEEPWWAKAGQDSRDSSTLPMTRSCRWGGSRLKIFPRSAWASTPKTKICYTTLFWH